MEKSLLKQKLAVVQASDLHLIYSNPSLAYSRYRALIKAFRAKFEHAPDFICRSPGRVNLIGEHIDYSGFSVLPMAIERDMVMAISSHKGDSLIANINQKYAEKNFLPDTNMIIDDSVNEWSNLFLCGMKVPLLVFNNREFANV
jgi:galactokinase